MNLRAIALYVRLVDLFDISDDRTPYAIWRFVAPIDGLSQMEWNKHRALSPVTFPEHGDGRCVRFDGSTSDPEVWAELEDLRHYCEEQIAGTMDLMARHRDERHQVDLRKLDWAVSAERFKPVSIRFEFHRQRMFEILADEIYQGDSHVFLRELLQNSIDAIRMRRELVQRRTQTLGRRRDVGLGFDDAIYFDVKHAENGDATVRCRDYGIGMDEYIVRNYLSVAGVSYYQSDEFRHLGLKMDPISRFGIGILSCFMVADRIEIETRREPQTAKNQEPVRIDIPAVDRQFRIYPGSGGADIGTVVTVHVVGRKLKGDVCNAIPEDNATRHATLRATEYLCAVAGFVEFPIIVDENGQRTIILHPDLPQSEADAFRIDGCSHEVHQLSNDYSWDKVFVPQDAQVAQMHLRQQSLDLRRELGLQDYEGTASYIRPVLDQAQLRTNVAYDARMCFSISAKDNNFVNLRMRETYGYPYAWREKEGIAPSSRTNHALAVYRDGLLVADAEVPRRDVHSLRLSLVEWPIPALRVNLPKKLAGNLDVTRRALRGTDESWDAPIWQGVVNYLKTHEIAEILNRDPLPRVYRLGQLALIFYLSEDEIAELVPDSRWPLPILVPNHGAVVADNQLVPGQIVRTTPESLNDDVAAALGWGCPFPKASDNSFLRNWSGDVCIARINAVAVSPFPEIWCRLSESHLRRVLAPVGVCFLRPPYPGLPYLPQNEFQLIVPSEIRELELMEQTMCDPLDLSGFSALRRTRWHYDMRPILNAAPFKPPFESFFIGNGSAPNQRHPTTIALLRCLAAVRWHQMKETRHPADIGKTADQLKRVAENLHGLSLQSELDHLWELVKRYRFLDLKEPSVLSAADYVPVSDTSRWMLRALSPKDHEEKEEMRRLTDPHLRPFGQAIDEIKLEDAPPEIIEAVSRSDRLYSHWRGAGM